MIDPSTTELEAMHSCLKPFGEAAKEIGYNKPLIKYSESEAMQIIRAIVSCYVEKMNCQTPSQMPIDKIPF